MLFWVLVFGFMYLVSVDPMDRSYISNFDCCSFFFPEMLVARFGEHAYDLHVHKAIIQDATFLAHGKSETWKRRRLQGLPLIPKNSEELRRIPKNHEEFLKILRIPNEFLRFAKDFLWIPYGFLRELQKNSYKFLWTPHKFLWIP